MKHKQLNIVIDDTALQQLRAFADSQNTSMTKIVKNAIASYIPAQANTELENKLLAVLNQYFILPDGFTPRTFFAILYLLAMRYPNSSSKDFWGIAVYIHKQELRHQEVFTLVRNSISLHQTA